MTLLRALAAVLLAAASAAVSAQGADVGLVNLVSGEVRYAPLAGAPGKVQPFMRVRDGDRFNLAAGAQLRIVFFEGARQERWQGPASLRAGRTQGEPIQGKPAEVAGLPADVPQRMARVSELVQNARLGGVQVRGGAPGAAPPGPTTSLAQARATYEKMRKSWRADDITPELYYYAALHEHQRYAEMRTVTDEMLRKQPDNEDVKALAAWVRARSAR
jgi:hypothetical protein